MESLYLDGRSAKGKARALDEKSTAALLVLRTGRPKVSLSLLMTEAKKRGIFPERVRYATVGRLFKSRDLTEASPPDRRRFESELPNDMWQSDAFHGPRVLHGGKMRKTCLFAFIDDIRNSMRGLRRGATLKGSRPGIWRDI